MTIYKNVSDFGALDDDGRTYNYTITPDPPLTMLTLTPANTLVFSFGSINNSFSGNYTVTVHAYGSAPNMTWYNEASFNLELKENQGPAINETFEDITFASSFSNSFIHSELLFSEPDGENIFLEGSFSPSSSVLSYDNITRTISGTPTVSDEGAYTFILLAYDGHPDTVNVSQSITLTVEPNQPPEANFVVQDQTILVGKYWIANWHSNFWTDPENDTIQAEVTHNFTGSWYTVVHIRGRVKGTPTASDIGNFTVNMRLYDDRGAENYYSYNVEIKPNSVPTYSNYENNITIFALKPWDLDLTTIFTDADGETLTWELIDVGSNLSSWIFADNSTNLISGTPQQPGSNYHESLKVVAVDEINQNATALFNFEVKRNDPPSFNGVTSTNFY